MNIDERLIEDLWTLFQRLEDSEDPEVVEAANNVARAFSFSINMLPEKLFVAVREERKGEDEESYYDWLAQEFVFGSSDVDI